MFTSSSCVSESTVRARIFLNTDGLPVSLSALRPGDASCALRCRCWPAGRDDGRGAARMPGIRHSRIESYLLKNGPSGLVEWPNRSVRMCGLVVVLTGARVSIAARGESDWNA
ncbi:hypothetical protein [Burkholderia pyrrocinia]|uniref:hypothetical protein n=1 Tax=Burkholderia pyrrocinia TaxID=60550 RepID=UPI001BCDC3C2|nr:hypothetical protein [Burkholderia pyrrocinia]QVN19247.1 hypothetical protein JYG32_05825 [Burkholderia pyrrocinia]